jgi:hypothetical protein
MWSTFKDNIFECRSHVWWAISLNVDHMCDEQLFLNVDHMWAVIFECRSHLSSCLSSIQYFDTAE